MFIYIPATALRRDLYNHPRAQASSLLDGDVDTIIITGRGNRTTQQSGSHGHILLYFRLKSCQPEDANEKAHFCKCLEERLENSLA